MSDKESQIQISDISTFNNYPQWLLYRQKAIFLAIVIWVSIIYIFILWIQKSIINSNRYKNSSHYLLLIDIVLITIYVWFIMPYHKSTNNKFSGIKEIRRQLSREEIESTIEELQRKRMEDAINKNCQCSEQNALTIESLKKQLANKEIIITKMSKHNKELSDRLISKQILDESI